MPIPNKQSNTLFLFLAVFELLNFARKLISTPAGNKSPAVNISDGLILFIFQDDMDIRNVTCWR